MKVSDRGGRSGPDLAASIFMKTKLKWAIVILAVIFIALQITSPARTNPSFDEKHSLQAMTKVPAEVSAVFARSCNDCHSNQTYWPWYTHIAPASWFTVGHVNDGRTELNFSEWGSYSERMKETRLAAICALTEQGKMPLPSYALLHGGAPLSPEEVKMICDWTKKESLRMKASSHE